MTIYPLTTGQVAHDLGLTEPQLNGLLRRSPWLKPPKIRGRYRWSQQDVQAVLGYLEVSDEPEGGQAA